MQEQSRLEAGLSLRKRRRESEEENKTFSKRIIVSVPLEMHEELRAYCIENNLNMSAFIRELIKNALPN